MKWNEEAVVFDCNGAPLIGVMHHPEQPKATGVVIVVPDGPQYRAGCARQLVLWSRYLCEHGYPVLRFDFSGLGDSGGEFKGFTDIDEDVDAAIDVFLEKQPLLEKVVLWGECSSASAIMMYAWRNKVITHLILQNPWLRDEASQAQTYIKHYYLHRLTQKSFWHKLMKFRFNPLTSLRSLYGLWRKSKQIKQLSSSELIEWDSSLPFQDRAREGLARFDGDLLLVMSGRSLIGKEFDEVVKASDRWQSIMKDKQVDRLDFEHADHTFSRISDREAMIDQLLAWLKDHAK